MNRLENNGDTMLKTLMVLFIALFTTFAIIGSTRASSANTDYDYTVAHSNNANQSPFWVTHFENAGYLNVTCTKYERHNGFVPGAYEAAVIKAGQTNYVWLLPGNTDQWLQAPQDLSHIFKCNWEGQKTYVVSATIIICQDPRAIITLVNDSNVPREFLIRFVSASSKEVRWVAYEIPANSTKVLKRWVLGKTVVKVYGEQDELLARARVDRATNIGTCPRTFTLAQ